MFRLEHFIYLLTLITISSAVNSNILQKNEYLEELAIYVTNFIFDNCNKCKNILISYPSEENIIINKLFYYLNKKIYFATYFSIQLNQNLTINDEFYNDYLPDLIVIAVNNFDQIGDVVYGIELSSFWSVRSKFLFIIEEIIDESIEKIINESSSIIKDVFTLFLERQMLRVMLCFWADHLHLFTYNPFSGEFNLDVLKNNSYLEIYNGRITNMHKYPLKLYFFDYVFPHRLIKTRDNDGKEILYGFDGIFFDLVANVLNASLEIHAMSEDFSADLVNSVDSTAGFMNYMKAVSDIFDFDGLFNAIYTVNPGDELDHVILFDRNDLIILVPKANVIPRYLYLILIIQPTVWFCISISFIVLSLIMAFAEKIVLRKFNLFGICLDNYR